MADDQKNIASAPSGAPPSGRNVTELPWQKAMDLPCSLSVRLSVPKMTVGQLVQLDLNSVVDSGHPEDAGVPVWVNGVNIGTSEFDVIGDHLIVRITETR